MRCRGIVRRKGCHLGRGRVGRRFSVNCSSVQTPATTIQEPGLILRRLANFLQRLIQRRGRRSSSIRGRNVNEARMPWMCPSVSPENHGCGAESDKLCLVARKLLHAARMMCSCDDPAATDRQCLLGSTILSTVRIFPLKRTGGGLATAIGTRHARTADVRPRAKSGGW